MTKIDVGRDFYNFLSNRNADQGNGKYTAIEFREKYLKFLDNDDAWKTSNTAIIFDFSNVDTMISSFANEAFAYFTKYAPPERIMKKIKFENITRVKMEIVEAELENGYKSK